MNTSYIDPIIQLKINKWLSDSYDTDTKNEIEHLKQNNPTELKDAFYRDLEFGTGGLRGIMGVGTNRINKYTVGMTTQGLANYLKKQFTDVPLIKVAIAYDSRNNSSNFAKISAEVLSANSIKVFLFDELRPTPELSFAIRYLKCQSGIVITASHNPKEYNGYKVYWDDGAQLVNPHDKNVIAEVQKIQSIDDVNFKANPELIEIIGSSLDDAYIKEIKSLSLAPDIIKKHSNLKIVFTPIHGTGVKLVPECLKEIGFNSIFTVGEQNIPDGNFPTVKSPNPEEPEALKMAIQKAIELNAELVLATDPDADRVGIAVKDNKGEFILLNGNQTATLLIYYLLTKWHENQKLKGKEYIVKTIVTSELLIEIAKDFKVDFYDVLTGFKYIAEVIRQNEGKKTFIGGGEESYGYLIGDFVRDKDAVSSCCMIAETAAWAASHGKTLYNLLIDIYLKYGFYKESLLSITKKGFSGANEIKQMMLNYRNSPPDKISGLKVVTIKDYLTQKEKNLISGITLPIQLPVSDVIQFFLEDGSKITVRPSGTEPKIKFYFGIKDTLYSIAEYEEMNKTMDIKLSEIINEMGLRN